MKKDLLNIFDNYGVNHQLRKFNEEVFELNEAIITHELKSSVEYEIPLTELIGTEDCIIEELADCYVMLEQFKNYYNISDKKIKEVMKFKIKRQLNRIENGEE